MTDFYYYYYFLYLYFWIWNMCKTQSENFLDKQLVEIIYCLWDSSRHILSVLEGWFVTLENRSPPGRNKTGVSNSLQKVLYITVRLQSKNNGQLSSVILLFRKKIESSWQISFWLPTPLMAQFFLQQWNKGVLKKEWGLEK